ncbi:MAG: RDD family protein [Phycisphaerales bacterium]
MPPRRIFRERPAAILATARAIATTRLLIVAVALVLLVVAPARGQLSASPAAGSVRTGVDRAAHAWAVVPEPRGGGFLLVHLPPRVGEGLPAGASASPAGRGRVVMRLEAEPEAIAAVGGRVYLAMPAASDGSRSRRSVYSVLAEAAGVGDLWLYRPERRLAAEASLPGQGRLAGFVGGPIGPVALIDRGGRGAREAGVGGRSRLELSVLAAGQWRAVLLPEGVGGDPGERFALATTEAGVALVGVEGAAQGSVWIGALAQSDVAAADRARRERIEEAVRAIESSGERVDRRREREIESQSPIAPIQPEWRRVEMQAGGAIASDAGARTPILVGGDRLVWASLGRDGVEIGSTGAEWASPLVTIEIAGTDAATRARFAGVAAGGRRAIVVLSPPGRPEDGRGSLIDAKLDLRLVEVSLDTGAVLYDGAMETGAPLGQQEVRALLIVVMGVSAVLLLWAIRGARQERAILLPEDAALAEPGDRLLAGLADYLVACIATGWLLGEGLWDVVTMQVLMGVHGPQAALVFLGVGVALGTLMEGLFGRTPGKVIFGVRVVAAAGRRRGTWSPPGLGRALGRNLYRWVLAPVALMELSRRDGRHAGDRLAGTAVAVELEDDDEEEGEQ